MLHTPCSELTMERPYRRCRRRPWAFCATSTIASSAPTANRAAPKAAALGANGMASVTAAVATMPKAATRADRRRRTAIPASSPASSAPAGCAARAVPKAALLTPRSALICG